MSGCLGSIPTGGNILSLDFFCFQAVKPLLAIFIAILAHFEKH